MSMEVWYAIPTANIERANRTLPKWKVMGYKIAVVIDAGQPRPKAADLVIEVNPYPGYWVSVNQLCRELLPQADIVVTGGDDIDPDLQHSAQQIAEQYRQRFPDLCGIMQPQGDHWQTNACAVSPWMGSGWLRRAYGGEGPFWKGYRSYFGDQELHEVAVMLGLHWHNHQIAQVHHHWTRGDGQGWPEQHYHATAKLNWGADKQLFYTRQAQRFPGHELLQEAGG